ncbi:hypothetical protein [Streptomyces sp. LN245]|uniref:hypothetical protein n=1 Tax=Streptomyces sp. LN245 TaxID=3112975 RepID=UPI0037164721
MTDHAATAATGRAPADPERLALEFHHGGRLMDPTLAGVQIWQVCVTADGEPVGSLRATRALWWTAIRLRERLTDEGSFPAEVAQKAWQEIAALGDEALPRGAGGLFGSLPLVILRQA